jgi:hypothetical protein
MTDNMTIKFIYHNHVEFERKDAFTTENFHEIFCGRISVVEMAGRASGDFEKGAGVSDDCEISPWVTNSCVTPPIISAGKKG